MHNAAMQSRQDLLTPSLPHAWADLQAEANTADWLEPEAHRLAFADPEFLLRRETRGIRFQLEMLKPDLDQIQQGVNDTVVHGSETMMSVSPRTVSSHAPNSSALETVALSETTCTSLGRWMMTSSQTAPRNRSAR